MSLIVSDGHGNPLGVAMMNTEGRMVVVANDEVVATTEGLLPDTTHPDGQLAATPALNQPIVTRLLATNPLADVQPVATAALLPHPTKWHGEIVVGCGGDSRCGDD